MNVSGGGSPGLKTGSTTGSIGGRKSLGSPSKKLAKGSGSPTKSTSKGSMAIGGLCGILGQMMDSICPTNLAASEGLGTDNMTGIIIEFLKPEAGS